MAGDIPPVSMGCRSMVGLPTLDRPIGVRIPAPQPRRGFSPFHFCSLYQIEIFSSLCKTIDYRKWCSMSLKTRQLTQPLDGVPRDKWTRRRDIPLAILAWIAVV